MAPERTILDGATVVTVDEDRTEHTAGHVVVENGRIAAVGDGPAPAELAGPRIDVTGCLVTPGLVNTHRHLYQWVTRGFAVGEHELTQSAARAHRTMLVLASTVSSKEGTAS